MIGEGLPRPDATGIPRQPYTAPNVITDNGGKQGGVLAVLVDDRTLIEAVPLFAVDIESLMKTIKLPLEKLSAAGLLATAQRFAPDRRHGALGHGGAHRRRGAVRAPPTWTDCPPSRPKSP